MATSPYSPPIPLIALLSLGALSLLGCTSEPAPLGFEVMGERVPVVDMHLHPGDWDLVPPATQAYLASRFPFPFNLNPAALAESTLSAEGIKAQLDGAGASIGVLLAVYAPRTVGVAPNELVMGQLDAFPERFRGLASLSIDTWSEDEDDELERLRDALMVPGMIGVKLAHAHQHFRMDDPRYYSIYEVAGEMNAPVYLHTGTSPFPGTAQEPAYTNPAYLEEAIALYPNTDFILGHLGHDFITQEIKNLDVCIDLAQRYDNVFLEPSALGSAGSDPTGRNLIDSMAAMLDGDVVDRIIYGSDGPQSPGFVLDYLERTVSAMEASGYSLEDIKAVLAGNYARVFEEPLPVLNEGGAL